MLDNFTWNRLEHLFDEASNLPPAEQEGFLRDLRTTEPGIAAELESLLGASPQSGMLVHNVVNQMVIDTVDAPAFLQQSFGPYQAIRAIAYGGMGTVFEAVRADEVNKRVALKVAATPIGSPVWVERFRQERQILAGLEHPYIARFLDAGRSANGFPYFAMELVEGVPITQYVLDNHLSLTARLELFLKACAAVSYAHQSLIVHRDLKPGNILVNASGDPKLLDFGIAKLLSPFEADAGATQTAPMLTPAYCAPEQAKGGKITTRTDVFQLGLILTEILTGRPVRDTSKGSAASWLREAAENPVPGPAEIALKAGNKQLAKHLSGDISVILHKATALDPSARYASVDQFAEDVQRLLHNEPIEARRPTFTYRLTKYVRRNWAQVAAAALVVLSLAGATGFSLWQARIAERRFQFARKVANSLLFDVHDKMGVMPGAAVLRERIAADAVQYLDALANEAGSNWALRQELAEGYLRLSLARGSGWRRRGSVQSSLASVKRGLDLVSGLPRDEQQKASLVQLQLRSRYADMLYMSSRYDESVVETERVMAESACAPENLPQCKARLNAIQTRATIATVRRDHAAADRFLALHSKELESVRQHLPLADYQDFRVNGIFVQIRNDRIRGPHEQVVAFARSLEPFVKSIDLEKSPPDLRARVGSFYVQLSMSIADIDAPAGRHEAVLQECIEVNDKALRILDGYLSLDPTSEGGKIEKAEAQLIRANCYLKADRKRETSEWAMKAIATFTENGFDNTNVANVAQVIGASQVAIQPLILLGDSQGALALSQRLSSYTSPAYGLGLKGPRSPAVQDLQARWFAGQWASQLKSPLAKLFWSDALPLAQRLAQTESNDPVAIATAALVLENTAVELDNCTHRDQAVQLWSLLAASHPENKVFRDRAWRRPEPAPHGAPPVADRSK